jgi:hypothetical protein
MYPEDPRQGAKRLVQEVIVQPAVATVPAAGLSGQPPPGAIGRQYLEDQPTAVVSGDGQPAGPSGRAGVPADTAAVCGCPRLQEPVARATSAAGVQPTPKRPAELPVQALAELLAHIGHGRPVQR